MTYKCEVCGGEIRSLFHDPANHDIRTNVATDTEGRAYHLQCPVKQEAA
jgi:hypothetical protein